MKQLANKRSRKRMYIHLDKSQLWKADIAKSVDFYNRWFLRFAPAAFKKERSSATASVLNLFRVTQNLRAFGWETLRDHPRTLMVLRMATCPPIARDRLIGLADAKTSLVHTLEDGKLPTRLNVDLLASELKKIAEVLSKLFDTDLLPWLDGKSKPSVSELERSATVIADRLCGSVADPIIRNAQEERQLQSVSKWLNARGYKKISAPSTGTALEEMPAGTYAFRMNVLVGKTQLVRIPVDIVIQPKKATAGSLPLLVEAKSAGDFTNTNKRRKEEAQKFQQLRARYGNKVKYVLFLCGYFDSGYLGYEAAEGIDWVWEHRIDDLAKLGL